MKIWNKVNISTYFDLVKIIKKILKILKKKKEAKLQSSKSAMVQQNLCSELVQYSLFSYISPI